MIMTESAVGYPAQPSTSTFWAAGVLGLLATAVGAILPVLVGVWQKQAGLQVDQAGFVAATELFAQVAGTGLFLWASPRWTLRTIALVGLGVMVIGSIATAVSVDFPSLISSRAIGGAGGGIIRALCMMCLAKAVSPGRAFAVYAGAQVGLAAVTTALIPQFIDSEGVRAPFLVLTLASVLGFALCPLLPGHSPLPASAIRHRGPGSDPMAAILAIIALFIFFVGQGALWTYLAPIGAYRSIPAAGVPEGLTLLNFAGLAGARGGGGDGVSSQPTDCVVDAACNRDIIDCESIPCAFVGRLHRLHGCLLFLMVRFIPIPVHHHFAVGQVRSGERGCAGG